MSRKIIASVLVGYFLAAFAYVLFIQLSKPFGKPNFATMMEALGGGSALFLISGLLPIIGWAFARFRREKAYAVLGAWWVIGIIVGLFAGQGMKFDYESKIDVWSKQSLTGKDRSDFVRSTNRGCVETQRQSDFNRQMRITEKQIDDYCGCYAEELTRALTADDLRYFAANGRPTAAAQQHIDRISQTCIKVTLGR
jgi:hypothetical protein